MVKEIIECNKVPSSSIYSQGIKVGIISIYFWPDWS